jgi:hypothetical protein
MTILEQSSRSRSFEIEQLTYNVAICSALKGDKFNWGNATKTEPAFLVYVGCARNEVAGYIQTFITFYRCYWCEIRQPKHLKDFEAEIKIRGMQRYSDSHAFGLDYLVESESAKHFGCDFDEYNYHATGYMPRW